MAGSQFVLKVERHVEAPGDKVPHGVWGDGGIVPVVGPVGPGGGDGPLQLAVRVAQASAPSFERNQVMPSACFVCLAHVSIRWPT